MYTQEQVEKEYQRIKALFGEIDEKQRELLDGQFRENARLRCELEDLNEIIVKAGGRVRVSKKNPAMQQEISASRVLERARASYLNSLVRLSKALGTDVEDDEDDLSEYE